MSEFLTDLHAEEVNEGVETEFFQLTSPLRVQSDVLNDIVEAPGGFKFDGESAPWPLKRFGFSRRAGAIHDWLYASGGYWPPVKDGGSQFVPVTRHTADKVYLELCLLSGMPPWRAHTRYRGLRLFGWKAWNDHRAQDVSES